MGHSLYPSSLKEKIQIYLCNNFPFIIPNHKFTAFVEYENVKLELERLGVVIDNTTFHNMRDLTAALKIVKKTSVDEIIKDIINIETRVSRNIEDLKIKEKLFPSICLWGTKR